MSSETKIADVRGTDAPISIFRGHRRASRLPSVPSALRGLDPRRCPRVSALIGASRKTDHNTSERILSFAVFADDYGRLNLT